VSYSTGFKFPVARGSSAAYSSSLTLLVRMNFLMSILDYDDIFTLFSSALIATFSCNLALCCTKCSGILVSWSYSRVSAGFLVLTVSVKGSQRERIGFAMYDVGVLGIAAVCWFFIIPTCALEVWKATSARRWCCMRCDISEVSNSTFPWLSL
jgi:hypothetical protein